jgi:hypothetical protein
MLQKPARQWVLRR